MNELKNFRKEFDVFFLKSIQDNIEKAQKHTSDKSIQQYLEYVSKIALDGKRLRPFVISMVLRDHNRKTNKDLLLGIEYLHLFALIHDDIVDQASLRHGVPTIHTFIQKKFNLSKDQAVHQAILVGDIVFNWAYLYILKASMHNKFLGLEYNNLISELVVGEMLDTDLPRRSKIVESLVVEKNKIKSGRYTFARPMQLGAIECNLSKKQTKQYFDLGEKIGELFQLVDDEIDVTSRSATLGKKTFQDFKEKQHTYFSFYLLNKSSKKYADIFRSNIWGQAITENDFEWMQEFLKESGAFLYVEKIKKDLLLEVKKRIVRLNIELKQKTQWYELTDLIYNRNK
jgi:geranylgeranyl pyrophosphate synthase